MSKLSRCEPGAAGAPPSAWQHGGPAAADYVEQILDNAVDGKSLPPFAQEGLFVWAGRGEATEREQLSRSAFRKPKDLRPLTLQNEDSKCAAGILNHSIVPTVTLRCSILQGGLEEK